jgi:hypothetical protein
MDVVIALSADCLQLWTQCESQIQSFLEALAAIPVDVLGKF